MSIINEALKKTQQKLSGASSSAMPAFGSQEKKGILPWILTTLILASLGCIAAFASLMYSYKQAMQVSMDKQKSKIIETVKRNYLPAILSPVSGKNSPEGVALNGIVTTGGERFVLLNNEIYRPGDYLGQRRILSISEDSVELVDQNKKVIILKTKRTSGGP